MLFLHCEDWCRTHGKTIRELLKLGTDVGVIWQDGRPFHKPYAIRMNLAVPNSLVREAMERTGGNISAAAKMLGVSRPTLYAKLKKYGL